MPTTMADSVDDSESYIEEEVFTTQPIEIEKDPAFLDCKLSLFTKTYLRGDNFTLDKQNTESNHTLLIKDLSEGN